MDVEQLDFCLNQLHSSYTSANAKTTIETLLKIHRNILFNKDDPKYRKLKLHNPVFMNQVWDLPPARRFMISSGWIQVADMLQFHRDENLLYIINILLEHRFVAPSCSEWKEETKIENLHISEQKEEKLRAKATLEREKELEEFKKDKIYREQLAENIKRQIAEDRKESKRKYVNPKAGSKHTPPSAICQKCDDSQNSTIRRLDS